MKFKEYDQDSPGFIGRERKRLAVVESGAKYFETKKLVDQVAYFDAMVDFICEYVTVPREQVEELSLNKLTVLHNKIINRITGKGVDPKDSAPSENG